MNEPRFPLVPDNYHLRDVGRTKQGNGYWITTKLASESEGTRDFACAYVFDRDGVFIFADIMDLGIRSGGVDRGTADAISRLKKKIDAETTGQIWVRPFSTHFFGYTFGLIVREQEAERVDDMLIDAMPGSTLLFYGPWDFCNYDS